MPPPLFRSGTKMPPRAGELPESAFYTIGNILAQTARQSSTGGSMSYWPRTQIEKELEEQRVRLERLRWLVEARQILQGETPVRIPYDEHRSDPS